jgi:hypothetical protein
MDIQNSSQPNLRIFLIGVTFYAAENSLFSNVGRPLHRIPAAVESVTCKVLAGFMEFKESVRKSQYNFISSSQGTTLNLS